LLLLGLSAGHAQSENYVLPKIVLQSGIGNQNILDAVVFSLDGRWIATADELSGEIKIWDVGTGNEIRTFQARETVWGLALSSSGQFIAAVCRKWIRIWDVENGHEVHNVQIAGTSAINAVAFSSDGSRLAAARSDSTVTIWDSKLEHELSTLTGYDSGVAS